MIVVFFHEAAGPHRGPGMGLRLRTMVAAARCLIQNEWNVCVAEIGTGTDQFIRRRSEIEDVGVPWRLFTKLHEIDDVSDHDFLFVAAPPGTEDSRRAAMRADLNVLLASLSFCGFTADVELADDLVRSGVSRSDLCFVISAHSAEERQQARETEEALLFEGWQVAEGFSWRVQFALECGRTFSEAMLQQLTSRSLVGEIARRGFIELEEDDT